MLAGDNTEQNRIVGGITFGSTNVYLSNCKYLSVCLLMTACDKSQTMVELPSRQGVKCFLSTF